MKVTAEACQAGKANLHPESVFIPLRMNLCLLMVGEVLCHHPVNSGQLVPWGLVQNLRRPLAWPRGKRVMGRSWCRRV